MDWHKIQDRELAFLQREKIIIQRKKRRGCCAAEWDLDLLESIIAAQQCPDALSLETVLLCKEFDLQRHIANIQWRRGEPSPAVYWQLECQREFLAELLSRYHAIMRNGAGEG